MRGVGRGRKKAESVWHGDTHLASGPLLFALCPSIFSTTVTFPFLAASSSSWSFPMFHLLRDRPRYSTAHLSISVFTTITRVSLIQRGHLAERLRRLHTASAWSAIAADGWRTRDERTLKNVGASKSVVLFVNPCERKSENDNVQSRTTQVTIPHEFSRTNERTNIKQQLLSHYWILVFFQQELSLYVFNFLFLYILNFFILQWSTQFLDPFLSHYGYL